MTVVYNQCSLPDSRRWMFVARLQIILASLTNGESDNKKCATNLELCPLSWADNDNVASITDVT